MGVTTESIVRTSSIGSLLASVHACIETYGISFPSIIGLLFYQTLLCIQLYKQNNFKEVIYSAFWCSKKLTFHTLRNTFFKFGFKKQIFYSIHSNHSSHTWKSWIRKCVMTQADYMLTVFFSFDTTIAFCVYIRNIPENS